MKKVLLSLAALFTFAAQAQKDITTIVAYPTTETIYAAGDTAIMQLAMINTGTVQIDITDTVFYRLTLGPYSITNAAGSPWNGALLSQPLDLGDTVWFNPAFVPVDQDMVNVMDTSSAGNRVCGLIELQNLAFVEADLTNNVSCNEAADPVGIDEVEKTFSTYPNPVVNNLFVNIETDNAEFRVYNMRGVLVSSSNIVSGENTIDVSNFSNGNYFYIIRKGNNNIGSGKFVK
ncbi:MAG: T9SS type A sorting domain-containing protein [Flavobacteriales bacterium]